MAEPKSRRYRGLNDEPGSGSRRSATVALVLLLCQAQGLLAPAFQQHHTGSTPQAARPVAHSRLIRNHDRRSQERVSSSSWEGGAFRRGWNSAATSSKGASRVSMMANPEGTQQLRDRDLEFMFYDEAQVGVLRLSAGLPFMALCSEVSVTALLLRSSKRERYMRWPLQPQKYCCRPDFNLVVGPLCGVRGLFETG